MKNLLKKLSRTEDRGWRDEIERQAADEIKTVGSKRPPEAASAPSSFINESSKAPAPQVEEPVRSSAAAPPAGRRLTAQQRAAARQLQ